jgi:hypothetical protein
MTPAEFRDHLAQLGLTQAEAAELLSVAPRTVRRWVEDGAGDTPGPAEHALRAWVGLQRRGLPWRPGNNDAQQIERYREHAIELYELLLRVEKRGGPSGSWTIDLDKGLATLGPMTVAFYKLRDGGFSPASYRRSDMPADPGRDWPLIEDAFACIAKAFAERERLKFVFLVTLQNGSILLWDVQKVPTIVMKIPCALLRAEVCADRAITDEQCRLLVECNKELVCELAETMYAAGRYETRPDKIRVLNATAPDLGTIASRFSSSVLDVTPFWVATESATAGKRPRQTSSERR